LPAESDPREVGMHSGGSSKLPSTYAGPRPGLKRACYARGQLPSTVLLSASIPEYDGSDRSPACDPAELEQAARAIIREILMRGGRISSGGHPSITPLLMESCAEAGRPGSLTVYQSERFRREIPESTWEIGRAGWGALRFTASFSDRERDLEVMRLAMVTDSPIAGAIFVGGDDGVAQEHELVQTLTYGVPRITLRAPGGVAAELRGSERTQVDVDSRSYRTVAQQISRAFGFR
jgi:hypothetical protein